MEWKHYKMDDVIDEISMGPFGSDVKKEFYVNKGIPILNGSNLQGFKLQENSFGYLTEEKADSLNKCNAHRGDIIVTHRGTLGQIVYVPSDSKYDRYVISQSQFRFRCKPDLVDVQYLVYYFHTREGQYKILANASQVGVPALARATSTFRLIDIKLPSLADQRRIASILSSLDRKIELNNKINADLEEMAQAIFKNWLSECSDDVTIGELSLNITNYEKTDAEEVVLINSSDVTEGYFDHHNYSPNKNLKGHFKKRFQKGDILYSQVRPRNRHWAYCNFDANDYLASTQLMVIRNNPSLITSILLYQYIISDNVWKEFTLKTETRSGTFPQGNYEDLSQIRVPYNCDVEGISNQLETLYAKMFMLEKENSRLSLLRDTLLPRLMSGELEVPE